MKSYVLSSVVLLEGALIVHVLTRDPLAVAMLAGACLLVAVALRAQLRPGQQVDLPFRPLSLAVVSFSGLCQLVLSARLGEALGVPGGWVAGLGGLLVVFAFVSVGWRGSLARISGVAMGVVFLLLGILFIEADGDRPPTIDVVVFQELGANYLLDGENPYSATYPNIYSEADSERFYGEGLATASRVEFGFPYTPLSLFMAVPGHALFGDFRYGQLVALIVVMGLVSSSANGQMGRLSGALLAVFPLGFDVLVGGWTEPYLLILLAGLMVAVWKLSRRVPYWFGLLLASKLSLIAIAPLYPLVDRSVFRGKGVWGRVVKVIAAGAAVTVPLASWDLPRFWFSVVELQLHQPFRSDALSVSVLFSELVGQPGGLVMSVVPFLVGAVAIVFVLRHAGSDPRLLPLAIGFVYLCWIAFTKQSFLNHYFFGLGALVLGLAYLDRSPDGSRGSSQGSHRMMDVFS